MRLFVYHQMMKKIRQWFVIIVKYLFICLFIIKIINFFIEEFSRLRLITNQNSINAIGATDKT